MAERPEDLNLPNAVVTRIIKDAIPEGVNVSKEARQAISKAASVFVLYATSCSNNFALKAKRKTISAQDVISAMDDMEFDHFKVPLHQCLDAYRKEQQGKKEATEKKKKAKEQGNASMEESDVIVIPNGDHENEEENDIVIEDYESPAEENRETGEDE